MSDVRASVLMPVRNGGSTVGDAVASVLADLGPRDELIVIDDGSTDDTREVIATLSGRVRLVPGDGSGIVAALNRGLEEAGGVYVARCDADDEWLPGHMAHLFAALSGRSGARIAFGAARLVDACGTPRGTARPPAGDVALRRAMLAGNPFVHGTVLAFRDSLVNIGGYREVPGAEDYDLWLRAYRQGWITTTSAEVYVYRMSTSEGHRAKRRAQARSSVKLLAEHAIRAREVSIYGIVRNLGSALWLGRRRWYAT